MFVFSKLIGLLSDPTNAVALAVILSTILLMTRFSRIGRALLGFVSAALVVIAVAPFEGMLIAPLESRFPVPQLPATIDGIVVLGGVIDPISSAEHEQPNAGGAIDRITALIELGTRYPNARIIFTGGSGNPLNQSEKEARYVRDYLEIVGFDSGRVEFEDQSRNTRENALFSKNLAEPTADQNWILVTSARHMPRAVGAFRAVGWDLIPWPVDYVSGSHSRGWPLRFNVAEGLGILGTARYEWIGLFSYYQLGWSSDLFPATLVTASLAPAKRSMAQERHSQ